MHNAAVAAASVVSLKPKIDELDDEGALVKPDELDEEPEELDEKPEELEEKLDDEEGDPMILDWNGTTLELLSLTSNVTQLANTSNAPASSTARPFVHVKR